MRLRGVHSDLLLVVGRGIQIAEADFMVLERMLDLKRQREVVRCGASRTRRSHHLTGHAVDPVRTWTGRCAVLEFVSHHRRCKSDIEGTRHSFRKWSGLDQVPRWPVPSVAVASVSRVIDLQGSVSKEKAII